MQALISRLPSWVWALPLMAYSALLTKSLIEGNDGLTSLLQLIPFAILGGYFLIFQTEFAFWSCIFLLPMSINFGGVFGGAAMSFPSEAMIWAFGIGLAAKGIQKNWIDFRIFRHPVAVIIMVQLVWIVVTVCTSNFITASLKLLIARLIFILVFFFFLGGMFRNFKFIRRYLWLWALGSVPIIMIAMNRLSYMGFTRSSSPAMATPWFTDHTVFSVCMTMLLPFFVLWFFNRKKLRLNGTGRTAVTIMVLLLTVAVLFSFSRAAWLSLALAIAVYILIRLRIPFLGFVLLSGTAIALFFALGDNLSSLSGEKAGKDANTFVATVSSITDTEKDESNMERLNRWSCAIRMYYDRPLFGFGPGTYEFFYGPYQALSEKTRISTVYGDRGDAHSEYLTALSEQGLPGLILLAVLILVIFYTGFRVIYRAKSLEVKLAATGILLGLFTYFFHGSVNSFLDIEKPASLFWAFTAMLVAMDVFHSDLPGEGEKKVVIS